MALMSRRTFVGALPFIGAGLPSLVRAKAPAPATLFQNVRIFDGRGGALSGASNLLVRGNVIERISTAPIQAESDATVIAGGGRTLMPGLIDNHWHAMLARQNPAEALGDVGFNNLVAGDEATDTLMRGFTTVRDMGGPVFALKRAIDEGIVSGPRIYPSGAMITTSGGHGDLRLPSEIPHDPARPSGGEQIGASAIVDDVGGLRRAVREQLMQGASQIKIVGGGGVSSPRSPLDMSTFSEDEVRAAADVARDWNTYITVHAYASNTVRRAISAGAACVEHAHLMDESTARLMANRRVWLSTQPFLSADDVAPQSGPSAERMLQVFAATPRLYALARRFGIKTAWGSDVLFSPTITPRQNVMLTHLSNWYSNAETMRMATSINAELLALSNLRNPYPGKLGVIERDAYADLLVLNGNPLEDIRFLENPAVNLAVVMKAGQVYKNTL